MPVVLLTMTFSSVYFSSKLLQVSFSHPALYYSGCIRRETEIRMLRNCQKEIERESNLSGDVYAMRSKLKALQDQVDAGERTISSLREEVNIVRNNLFSINQIHRC